MAQVRKEYLRWIVLHKRATHLDGVKDLRELMIIWKDVLRALPQEDFESIRNKAREWLFSLPQDETDRQLREYDDLSPLPMPYRIDWSKQIPIRYAGSLLNRKV